MPLWLARLPVSSTEVDSVRFLLDRGVTLSWRVVGESTRAVPMESPPRHLKDLPAYSSPVLASQF